ncbi:MAG: BON domain-containing protein [Burkholderiaceae bacterium]|jgi:osmotically-inducible protein OsmY|nr:BON domain-containing protein [Burkholderiaceae bacterium]
MTMMTSLHWRLARTICAALALAACAIGCVPVVLVGGAAAASTVVMDRRSSNLVLADQEIENRGSSAVRALLGDKGHVNVTSYYRKVLLSGEVPTEQDRQRVQAAISKDTGVVGVINELAVGPGSTLTQRATDLAITARVKSGLLNANGVPGNSIKVVTERNTTYLMGRLTQRETRLATEVARTTGGVHRVIRVIDLISDEEALYANEGATTTASSPAASASKDAAAAEAAPPPGAEQTSGVVAQPVTQPTIQQVPPIQVQTLPPIK